MDFGINDIGRTTDAFEYIHHSHHAKNNMQIYYVLNTKWT